MSEYFALKKFFKALNTCNTIESVENALRTLSQKDVSLNIFDESIGVEPSGTEYLNLLNSDLNMFDKFIQGEHVVIGDKNIFPILLKGQLVGCIEIPVSDVDELYNFEIAAQIVALKIDNLRLNSTISKNLEFHNAMKNIAKIIESQYELNYIIPLIGEILDTFVENHLIYIFLKQNGKMKLVWPAACLDDKITKNVPKYTKLKEFSFSKNKKTGYFPLVSENNAIGCIVTKSTLDELSTQELYYIQQLVKQTATTITRAKVYGEILKYATLDALTGFYNRRQLDERVRQEVSQAKRKNTSLCAIMADIDFFKRVNDTYGHATGDLVLKTVAKIMRGQLREYDIAARYGGEEFVILLPSTSVSEAEGVAERLRDAVNSKAIDIEKVNTKNSTKKIRVSISVGISEYDYKSSPETLVMQADKALYKAKETGRNKVVLFDKDN